MSSFYRDAAKKDYWIKAKYNSQCKECEADIREGENVLYSPSERAVYCESCGEYIQDK